MRQCVSSASSGVATPYSLLLTPYSLFLDLGRRWISAPAAAARTPALQRNSGKCNERTAERNAGRDRFASLVYPLANFREVPVRKRDQSLATPRLANAVDVLYNIHGDAKCAVSGNGGQRPFSFRDERAKEARHLGHSLGSELKSDTFSHTRCGFGCER